MRNFYQTSYQHMYLLTYFHDYLFDFRPIFDYARMMRKRQVSEQDELVTEEEGPFQNCTILVVGKKSILN